MLAELEIENLAVISHAQIQFSPQFNVFTGETGAGKSILIQGIRAVLGERVTRDIVRAGCKKATITARFTGLNVAARDVLDSLSISDEDDEILLTREISADGKSTARVDGHVTTASILREIGTVLIDIHGQHENQRLLSPATHLEILDAFCTDPKCLLEYQEMFRALQQTAKQLQKRMQQQQNQQRRQEYLLSFLEDGEALHLEKGTERALTEEMELLQHAQEIAEGLRNAAALLDSGSRSETAVTLTETARDSLESFRQLQHDFDALWSRLDSARIELKDIAEECRNLSEKVVLDPARYDEVQRKLNDIACVCRDYHCGDGDALVDELEQAREELAQMQDNEADIAALSEKKTVLLKKVSVKAKELTEIRKATMERLSAAVTEQLEFLNMSNVVFTGHFTLGNLTIHGEDNLEFYISANVGEPPRPLSRIASGGELSRIMLALKCAIADRDSIPTMIFDEIDTGVGGKAAQKIGLKLQEASEHTQVLCVTHLAQIAALADTHLYIEKKAVDNRTETTVTELDDDTRISEIARMMGGENKSESVIQSAREAIAMGKRKK